VGELFVVGAILGVVGLPYALAKPRRSTLTPTPPPSHQNAPAQSERTGEAAALSTPGKPRSPVAVHAGIELNADFRAALEVIATRRESAFITGKAGAGKSTLLKLFSAAASGTTVVLAPTGLAAINVGGQTIHSFFRFPPRLIDPAKIRPSRTPELLRRLETIIIDEISMVRADLLDGIDVALKLNRGRPDAPFGGVQVVFFGDLFQLPPIVREPALRQFFASHYGSPYFFRAKALAPTRMPLIELTKVYRQTDPTFVDMLNKIRNRSLDDGVLRKLNSRVREISELKGRGEYLTLTPTNQAAFDINIRMLEGLAGPEHNLLATVSGRFDESAYPTEATLRLKKGARVMMIRNDANKRWVNGTLALVTDVSRSALRVRVGAVEHDVQPDTWQNIEYYYDRDAKRIQHRVIGTFQQVPVRLAWAITIHKSQGQTFDRVYVDLGRGAFAHGQTYVALSRCRSLEGLTLARPVSPTDVIFDDEVEAYRAVFAGGA